MNEVKEIAFKKINYEFSGQVKYFARCVINEIFEYCENTLDGYSLTEEHINDAIDLILDLQITLHWGADDKTSHLYRCFNWNNNLLYPWCNDVFFLDLPRLENIISSYLGNKWFSSPTFEWYIINPYLRVHINNYRDFVFYGSNPSRILNIPPNTFLKHGYNFIVDKIFTLSLSGVLYGLPLYLISKVFEKEWTMAALLFSLGYLYFLTSEIIGFIKILCDKKQKRGALFKLVDLKINISAKSWSPTKIMENVTELEKKLNIPELSPLVSKMIKRDPDVFNSIC